MLIYAVDDEKSARFYLEEAIKECLPNDELITFDKPTKLLEAFQKRQADLVFSDIEMPGMQGIDLAKELIKIKENLNIIFVTGYSEYALDALKVYASGYLLKPCNADGVREAIKKLRYPVESKKDIYIKTFGNFEVFYKGKPVRFRSPRGKEMIAYLIDRHGATVTRPEMASIVFEDEYTRNIQAQLSHIAKFILDDFKALGMDGFFISNSGFSLRLEMADVDSYKYIDGDRTIKYMGEYMEQYSWGEYKKGYFSRL